VVNTTADELADMAVEISVWDLDGVSPYYEVTEKIVVPPKKVKQIIEMKYPQMKDAKPVYFLLLKLFRLSDNKILSRNFYWLHLPGRDYKLLEQYQKKKIPLRIESEITVSGSIHKVRMTIENKSKKSIAESTRFVRRSMDIGDGNGSYGTGNEATQERQGDGGLWSGLGLARSGDNLRKFEVSGTDSGVAFFLHFSVHTSEPSTAEEKYIDTRILPVHYSDNYVSLTPGEKIHIDISFEAPQGSTPRVVLRGWNHHPNQTVLI